MCATTPTLLTESRPRIRDATSTNTSPVADAISNRRFDREIVTRIVAPVAAALTVLAMISHSSPVVALVIFVAAWVVLDIAAVTVGRDSRDGLDWRPGHVDRLSHNRW